MELVTLSMFSGTVGLLLAARPDRGVGHHYINP